MRESMFTKARAVVSLPPAERLADANGTGVDRAALLNNARSALMVVTTGTVTDGTHSVSLEVSDDGTTWSTPSTEFIEGQSSASISIATTDDDAVKEMGYFGPEQHLRAVHAASGTTGAIVGVVFLLGDVRREPVDRTA